MERKIGEIFEYNGEWYQCVKQPKEFDKPVCILCAFQGNENCDFDRCSSSYRSDKKNVIFKKLEKVGEPYNKLGIVVQKYKVDIPIEMPDEPNMYFRLIDNTVEIEIKQNKEDMEEKKVKLDQLVTDYTSNKITYNEFEKAVKEPYADKEESKPSLKSFSLEAAKAGKPVCTRDGRKVRIICFDRFDRKEANKQIVALVKDDDREFPYCYDLKGRCLSNNNLDLMMLSEKHEGWVNIYKSNYNHTRYVGGIYKTKKEALKGGADYTVVDTVKIEWEE